MTLPEKPRLPDTVQAAIENIVGLKEEEKKWAYFAGCLGMSEGVLRNKVAREKGEKEAEKRHHLTLAEAIAIGKASQDTTLIQALCKEFGGEFLHHPGLDSGSDDDLLSHYTGMMRELGQFSNDIHLSLVDGEINSNEIQTLRKDFLRVSAALSEVMDRLQARADRDNRDPNRTA